MYLKSLVLKGFKSFADRTVLSLEPGITAIVGPNGSGKSNISDAVLWVLGERNAKNLRGQVMEDVIFSGSKARKGVAVAQVDLVLDNSDGELPVDYSEVTISRRMYRTGESDYLINGTSVRRMDILDILHDSGLGTGTHSIIAQGHLDSILQSKPEERRALIEEAAGILKHKQRKEKSRRKIEQMDTHLLRVKDVVAEVERQLGPLERKAKKAMAYKQAKDELAEYVLQLAVDDLRLLQAQWESAARREAEESGIVEQAQIAIQEADAENERLQAELQAQTSGAVEVSRMARRLSECHERLDSGILLVEERRRAMAAKVDDLQARISLHAKNGQTSLIQMAQDKELQEAADMKTAAEAKAGVLAQDYARIAAEVQSSEARAFDILKRRQQTESDLRTMRKAYAQASELRASNAGKLDSQQAQLSRLEEDLRQAQEGLDASAAQLAALEEGISAAEAEDGRLKAKVRQLEESRSGLKAGFDASNEASRAYEIEAKGLREIINAYSSHAGELHQALVAADSDYADDLRLFVDSISVDAEYEQLVERLLGSDINTLVLSRQGRLSAISAEAKASQRQGSVTLLLDEGRRPSTRAREVDSAQWLMGQIRCDERNMHLAMALLGDIYVCDGLGQAMALRQSHPDCRFATIDGDCVLPNGKVTISGRPAGESIGLISAKQRLAKAVELSVESTRAAESAKEALLRLDDDLRMAKEESFSASGELARLNGEKAAIAKARSSAKANRDSLEARVVRCRDTIGDLQAALAADGPDTQLMASRIQETEAAIIALDEESHQVQELLNPLRNRQQDIQEKLNASKLEAARLSERVRMLEKAILESQSEQERKNRQYQSNLRELARCERILKRYDELIPILSSLSCSSEARSRDIDERIIQSQSESDSCAAAAAAARIKAREQREAYEKASERLSELRVLKGRLEVQVSNAITAITQDCGASLDAALSLPALPDRAAAQEQADKLRRRIANMGNVNPDAAQEYEEVRVRYEFLSRQLRDLVDARASLRQIDNAIDAKMKEDFNRTFQVVNANFQEIFSSLFPEGRASLSLIEAKEGGEPGVEVEAQPAGKNITKMSLMSGGEKSLVAMALLFAVYKTRTTPFYILDEVEAALDDTNLRRLCHYLEELRSETQFIMITHQRRTMEMADVLFGVSMQNDGITRVISQKLERALEYAED